MSKYIKREDAVFASCKVLDKFGGCKMGPLCPDVGCSEVRDIIDTFQMIEIPERHGRLIDADALAKHVTVEWFCGNKRINVPWRAIEDAPSIIPASEEEIMYYHQVPGITPTVI